MVHPDLQRSPGHATQSRCPEQLDEMALARPGKLRLIVQARVQRPCRVPEQPERPPASGVVPDAGRDGAARPCHAPHLGQPPRRVVHEVDNELRKRGVELAGRERELFGRRLADIDSRVPLPGGGDERRRWIDRRHRASPQAGDELARERPGATADIERPLSRVHRGEICELTGQDARVSADERVVGRGGDVEAHARMLALSSSGSDTGYQRAGSPLPIRGLPGR